MVSLNVDSTHVLHSLTRLAPPHLSPYLMLYALLYTLRLPPPPRLLPSSQALRPCR